jgi:hypothetical protein
LSNTSFRKAVSVVALLVMASCKTVPAGPGDTSPPKAEFLLEQPNGQWEVVSEINMYPQTGVKLTCRVTDPEGVKSAWLYFTDKPVTFCNVPGKGPFTGASFQLKPSLPDLEMKQTLSGNAKDEVLQVLPLIREVPEFFCKLPTGETGWPGTHTVIAKCRGTNWSSDPQHQAAEAELKMKF